MRTPAATNSDGGSLAGRVVLVAGGSGGLGWETVSRLAGEGAVVVVGFRANRERARRLRREVRERWGREVLLAEGDIAEEEGRRRCLAAVEEAGAPLYGLVCFSGDPGRVKFERATQEDLLSSLRQNYVGPILLARDAARLMRRDGVEGSIVLFSTMQAVEVFAGSVNYAAPKAALIHAARVLASEWGGKGGLRVNVVAPGVNEAGMALKSIESGKYDPFLERGVIPRFGKPRDVARVVRLLLEPDNYLTGQVICVDGGFTLRK